MKYLLVLLLGLGSSLYAWEKPWSYKTQDCMQSCFDKLVYMDQLSRNGVDNCMDKCEMIDRNHKHKSYHDRYQEMHKKSDFGYKNKKMNTRSINISIEGGYVHTKGHNEYFNNKTFTVKRGETEKYYLTTSRGYKKPILLTLTENNEVKVQVDDSRTYVFKNNSHWFNGETVTIDALKYNGKTRIFDLNLRLQY